MEKLSLWSGIKIWYIPVYQHLQAKEERDHPNIISSEARHEFTQHTASWVSYTWMLNDTHSRRLEHLLQLRSSHQTTFCLWTGPSAMHELESEHNEHLNFPVSTFDMFLLNILYNVFFYFYFTQCLIFLETVYVMFCWIQLFLDIIHTSIIKQIFIISWRQIEEKPEFFLLHLFFGSVPTLSNLGGLLLYLFLISHLPSRPTVRSSNESLPVCLPGHLMS